MRPERALRKLEEEAPMNKGDPRVGTAPSVANAGADGGGLTRLVLGEGDVRCAVGVMVVEACGRLPTSDYHPTHALVPVARPQLPCPSTYAQAVEVEAL
jgi:hypothetical protein